MRAFVSELFCALPCVSEQTSHFSEKTRHFFEKTSHFFGKTRHLFEETSHLFEETIHALNKIHPTELLFEVAYL